MKTRDIDLKIPDIKAFRLLCRLLSKLGIQSLIVVNPLPPYPWQNSPNHVTHSYGLGLKEAKDLVERMWDYRITSTSKPQMAIDARRIHYIKRTRQFIHMLEKLGVQSAGEQGGLFQTKQFVLRMRNCMPY